MKDRALTAAIHRMARAEPRAGCRGVTRLLRREGWQINGKRVHRIWKRRPQGALRLRPTRKRACGSVDNSGQRQSAARLSHVWTCDFIRDQTDDGGRLKWLPIVGEYSRELLSVEAGLSITAEDAVRGLERLVCRRGVPEFIRSGNGTRVRGACGEGLDRGKRLQDLLHQTRQPVAERLY